MSIYSSAKVPAEVCVCNRIVGIGRNRGGGMLGRDGKKDTMGVVRVAEGGGGGRNCAP